MVGFCGANEASPTPLFPSKHSYTLLRSALPTTKPPHVHSYSSFATISAGLHARLRPDLSGTCLAVRARDIQTLAKGVFGKAIEFAPASHGNLTVGEETIVTAIEL